jgi:hypothetical protein
MMDSVVGVIEVLVTVGTRRLLVDVPPSVNKAWFTGAVITLGVTISDNSNDGALRHCSCGSG